MGGSNGPCTACKLCGFFVLDHLERKELSGDLCRFGLNQMFLNVAVSVALMLQAKFCALFPDAVAVPRRVVSATRMVQARQHPDAVTVRMQQLCPKKRWSVLYSWRQTVQAHMQFSFVLHSHEENWKRLSSW